MRREHGPRPQTAALVDIGAGLTGPSGLRATVYTKGLTSVSALAFDSSNRLWIATADFEDEGRDALYVATEAGATPVEGRELVAHADGSSLVSGLALRRVCGRASTAIRASTARSSPSTNASSVCPRMSESRATSCSHLMVACRWASLRRATAVSLRRSSPPRSCRSCPTEATSKSSRAASVRPSVSSITRRPNDLFVTMNQRDDLDPQTPGDWLAVVHQGEAWGFPDCYGQGGTVCTDVPQPVAALDAHAAVSGVAIVTGQLGTTIGTSAIVAEWADGKVQQVALAADGSAYAGTVRPFLTGLKNPVPVMLSFTRRDPRRRLDDRNRVQHREGVVSSTGVPYKPSA